MKKIEEDILYISEEAKKLGFENKSFLVSGATGMIGRMFINALKQVTKEEKIFVMGLDEQEARDVYKDTKCVPVAFNTLNTIKGDVDYIIHLASPTNSKFMTEKPVETISFIYESTKQLLDFAREHHSKMLYVSSMEVFGEVQDEEKRSEADLGNVSLTNTRSSYPETKRLCELLCYSYAKEFDLPVYIARLAQTFGAGTISTDTRIFGYMARCVLNNENIVLQTKGDSYGNYCYLADTLKAFFYILEKGEKGQSYNVVGDNTRSTIKDLAYLVAEKIAMNKIHVEFNLNNSGIYPKPTLLNMDNKAIKAIGWAPKYGLVDMFERMIASWQE